MEIWVCILLQLIKQKNQWCWKYPEVNTLLYLSRYKLVREKRLRHLFMLFGHILIGNLKVLHFAKIIFNFSDALYQTKISNVKNIPNTEVWYLIFVLLGWKNDTIYRNVYFKNISILHSIWHKVVVLKLAMTNNLFICILFGYILISYL